MSLKALAEAVGISLQQMQKYETAEDRISAGRLWDVAGVLGVHISAFFEEGTTALQAIDLTKPSGMDAAIIQKLVELNNPAIKRSIIGLILAMSADRIGGNGADGSGKDIGAHHTGLDS